MKKVLFWTSGATNSLYWTMNLFITCWPAVKQLPDCLSEIDWHKTTTSTAVNAIVCTGAKAYIACRSVERAQKAVDDIVNKTGISRTQLPILQLDLASFQSIRSFVSSFKQSKHVVIWLYILDNGRYVLVIFTQMSSFIKIPYRYRIKL